MILEEIANALEELKEPETIELTEKAIQDEIPATRIILKGLCLGMDKVGQR